MRHLERYTPEVCSQLRQIAEHRQWKDWYQRDFQREELLEDMELTYHLHVAAEVNGARKGMPPMPSCPVRFIDSEGLLDPVEFLNAYKQQRHMPEWNQSDNAIHREVPPVKEGRPSFIKSWVAAACLTIHLL